MPPRYVVMAVIALLSAARLFPSLAQSTEPIPLSHAIKLLEQTFDVRFSYAEKDLEGVLVIYRDLETLEEELEAFEDQLPFDFNRISARYYSIVKRDSGYLCGKLVAADSGKPLSGASIVAIGAAFGAITDESGFFHLPKSVDSDQLEVRYLGYEKLLISTGELGANCPVILLQTTIASLNTVFIKRFLVPGLDQRTDGSTSIRTDAFGLLPGQVENDVLQIAQAIPGVQSVNESIANINIRGGTNDENLILWNGIKMYQNGHFFGLITAFNPDITQRVSVYKDGSPIRFTDGVSGTIAMNSSQELSNQVEGNAGVNMLNANAYLKVPLGKDLNVEVSGRRSINDLWETSVYQSFAKKAFQDTEITNTGSEVGLNIDTNVDFSFYDFSGRLLWDPGERDKVRLNFLTISNQLDLFEELAESDLSENNDLQQESMAAGLSWERKWNDKFQTNFTGYGTLYDLNSLNRDIKSQQEVLQQNKVEETSALLEANYRLSYSWSFQAGYQFIETGISNTQDVNLPRFRDFEKDVLRTHAGFAGFRYSSLDDRTRIRAGIRANYYDKFARLRLEPRFSVLQKLSPGLAFEVLGELKSQPTSTRVDLNSDFLGLEKRRWILADENGVPVKESRQITAGVIYDKAQWLLSLKGFFKEVAGITAANQGFQNQFQFVQTTGSYSATGAELTINRRARNYSVWFTYVYLDNQFDFPELSPRQFPSNQDITHSINLAGTYYAGPFKFAAGLSWRSGKPYTIPVEGNELNDIAFSERINFDLPNNLRLEDYLRLDASVEYALTLTKGVKGMVNLSVLNILDKANILNRRYQLLPDQDGELQVNQIESISLGLTPNLAFRVKF